VYLSTVQEFRDWALIDMKIEALSLVRDPASHAPWPIFPILHPEVETRIVHLQRKNTLAQIISYEKLERSGVALQQDEQSLAPREITLNPNAIYNRMVEFRRRDQLLTEWIGKPDLTLWYEDLFDPDGCFSESVVKSCANLMGISSRAFNRTPEIQKMQGTLTISNAKAIARRMDGTPFEWMVAELWPEHAKG